MRGVWRWQPEEEGVDNCSLAKGVAILGATGSIGQNTLSVIRAHPGLFKVVGISGHTNRERLLAAAQEFSPEVVVLTGPGEFPEGPWRLLRGQEGLLALATHPKVDVVVVATGGLAGALPTIEALRAGKRVALANKETMVAFGPLVNRVRHLGELVPVDSEHSALFQLLEGREAEATRLVITGSGGPFLGWDRSRLARVTPEMALSHPTWRMGPKITVDSATLMNKALEVIEAHFLFGFPPEAIQVLICPGSLVHALVELADGSWLAHVGYPDMRIPIQYALTWPQRLPSPAPKLDLVGKALEFMAPDTETFSLLPLAWEALARGGTAPAVLNAANEEAVWAFLKGRLDFLGIFDIVEKVFHEHKPSAAEEPEDVEGADAWARARARELIGERKKGV